MSNINEKLHKITTTIGELISAEFASVFKFFILCTLRSGCLECISRFVGPGSCFVKGSEQNVWLCFGG